MLSTKAPHTDYGLGKDGGQATVNVSIAVDPIRWDEFQRETHSLPVVRIMERRSFQSEQEAETYFRIL